MIQEVYKDFEIEYLKVVNGFDQYTITIKKYSLDNKYYYLKIIKTDTNIIKNAKIISHTFIDNLKSFKWNWNGIKKYNPKEDNIKIIERRI